jgi:hypothetical protein
MGHIKLEYESLSQYDSCCEYIINIPSQASISQL